MNRRGFLDTVVKLGTGSALILCSAVHALGLPAKTRHALWYAGHCVHCGKSLPKAESLTGCLDGERYWCRFCAEYGPRDEWASYRTAPPAWV